MIEASALADPAAGPTRDASGDAARAAAADDAIEVSDTLLQRQRRRIAELERLLAERDGEARLNQQQMSAVYGYLLGLYEVVPGALLTITPKGEITRTNQTLHTLLGTPPGTLITHSLARYWPDSDAFIARCLGDPTQLLREEVEWVARDGSHLPLLLSAACQRDSEGDVLAILCVALDLREQRKLELDLRHAQKLESLGQLAAGIAHEINTPMQFVGDNLHFIREAFETLGGIIDRVIEVRAGRLPFEELCQAIDSSDFDFLRQRVPRAVLRSIDGVSRVAGIVEAMKRFSHQRADLGPVDINASLADALVVAHNEYKYAADVQTAFGDIPRVIGHGGDLNQVFLNLLINAAHAIQARPDGARGTITISTERVDDCVVIHIGDTGTGIPEGIRQRVFEPFFTTKPVGKGTGQGLAISRHIVVDRHHGTLDFVSSADVGTTFNIALPIAGPPVEVAL